ncbi:MAG: hypothetical protein H6683_08080 [Deltaproteobacteria bacterium]|nr:hypothetical protein [Deltaproteobacteria bacterium]MCB9479627.1 hypothetical protein [Deltaproteobacteria bacterium]
MPPFLTRHRDALFLALVMALAAAGNVYWLGRHAPPVLTAHNTAMIAVGQMHDVLDHPVAALRELLFGRARPHESVFNLTALATLAVFGWDQFGLVLNATMHYLLAVLGVFLIARRLAPDDAKTLAGTTAAVGLALLPGAFIWSRVFLPSIGVMSYAALGVALVLATDGFRRVVPSLALGLYMLVAVNLGETVSDNFQIIGVVGLMAAFELGARLIVTREHQMRALLLAAGSVLVFALLVSRWELRMNLQYLWREGAGPSATRYGPGGPDHGGLGWLTYPALLWTTHALPFFCVAGLVSCAALAVRPTKDRVFALTYLIAPLVLGSLAGKKNSEYLFATLPALPIVVGLAVARIRSVKIAYAAVAAVVVLGAYTYAPLTFIDGALTQFSERVNLWARDRHVVQGLNAMPAFRSPGRVDIAETLARHIVDVAKKRPESTTLLLAPRLGNNDATAFRLHLALLDWDSETKLLDPFGHLGEAGHPLNENAFRFDPAAVDMLIAYPERPEPRFDEFVSPEALQRIALASIAFRSKEDLPPERLAPLTTDLAANVRRLLTDKGLEMSWAWTQRKTTTDPKIVLMVSRTRDGEALDMPQNSREPERVEPARRPSIDGLLFIQGY